MLHFMNESHSRTAADFTGHKRSIVVVLTDITNNTTAPVCNRCAHAGEVFDASVVVDSIRVNFQHLLYKCISAAFHQVSFPLHFLKYLQYFLLIIIKMTSVHLSHSLSQYLMPCFWLNINDYRLLYLLSFCLIAEECVSSYTEFYNK